MSNEMIAIIVLSIMFFLVSLYHTVEHYKLENKFNDFYNGEYLESRSKIYKLQPTVKDLCDIKETIINEQCKQGVKNDFLLTCQKHNPVFEVRELKLAGDIKYYLFVTYLCNTIVNAVYIPLEENFKNAEVVTEKNNDLILQLNYMYPTDTKYCKIDKVTNRFMFIPTPDKKTIGV